MQTVTFSPGGLTSEVCKLEVNEAIVQCAVPGDFVCFTSTAASLPGVQRGVVMSETHRSPARLAASFVGQLTVLSATRHVAAGRSFNVDVGSARVLCRLEALLQKMDRRSGKVRLPGLMLLTWRSLRRLYTRRPTWFRCCALFLQAARWDVGSQAVNVLCRQWTSPQLWLKKGMW